LNQKLAKRIECVEYAISDSSDKELAFESQGPGTTVEQIKTGGKNLNAITSLSIDDLVKKKQLTNVNFIKLDIEGAELKGLQGAEQTLKTFKPKLAISAYHKKEDLFTLIQYLEGLKIGYRFYMDHFTVHGEETVLFATCD
jgi:FkbM family methyltransferase